MNIRDFNTSLNNEQLRQRAPAIFAENPANKVSDRYAFVPTHRVLSVMQDAGFVPIFASQQKVRSDDRLDTTKHQVMLRRDNVQLRARSVGDVLPTLHVVNSHDWSSRFEVRHAMLRLACANGMMIESGVFSAYSIRHDTLMEDIGNLIQRFMSGVSHMQDTIDTWSGIQLDSDKRHDFARRAMMLRFPDATAEMADRILIPQRAADMGDDLWTTYNRIQEYIIRGGFKGERRRARAIGNIDKGVELNTQLFALAESYAQ